MLAASDLMAESAIQLLNADEALLLLDSPSLPCVPGTLRPPYVQADAVRDPGSEAVWLLFERGGAFWLHAVLVRPIAGTPWRDASSPYGYGGPLSTTSDPGFVAAAWHAYEEWMRAAGVVVEYVRFHPLLGNERLYGGRVENNRTVVSIPLQGDAIEGGYEPRLRHTLKKSERAQLRYDELPLAGCWREFADYYRAAMRDIGADDFYFFENSYFSALAQSGLARVGICRGPECDDWLAACLLLDGRSTCEYHLAATNAQGRRFAASSYVLHGAAIHARGRGAADLFLGGGTDRSPENRLLFFKSAFSRKRLAYRTGSAVFLPDFYRELQDRFPDQWRAHPERPIFYRKV